MRILVRHLERLAVIALDCGSCYSTDQLTVALNSLMIDSHAWQVGDELEIKGPIPKFPYKPNMKKNIGEHRAKAVTSALPLVGLLVHNPR